MVEIKIKNNLEKKLDELQKNTGIMKTFMAKELGMTPQRLYHLCKASNVQLDTAYKFSVYLNCSVTEIFEYEVIR
ncbi:helix-turn-helix transcriptional regulator [Desulfosporosinus sp. FKB]|uniref:helix-turn-helix domain-containing protein n=1 Tax=Desulfosporosinus sp. FKB TaxID=1969835 RepID=UPI000B4A4112|nr:helix-turn-helix transcriptional regulator [Desulfosporosinus sp. FKB]